MPTALQSPGDLLHTLPLLDIIPRNNLPPSRCDLNDELLSLKSAKTFTNPPLFILALMTPMRLATLSPFLRTKDPLMRWTHTPLFVVAFLLTTVALSVIGCSSTEVAGARPKRPQQATLGHWKDEGANLYVSKGPQGLACTWVFSDGSIEEHQMVIKGENMNDGVLTLVQWYRADQRSGGKPAGVATFSDGREMKEEWRFDGDKKSFTVWGLHFTDGMTQRQTMRYVDDARKP